MAWRPSGGASGIVHKRLIVLFYDHGKLLMIVVDLVSAYVRLSTCNYVSTHTHIAFAHLFISMIVCFFGIWCLRKRGVSCAFDGR